MLPWQEVTVGSSLMLAAASRIHLDAEELHRQLTAAIDSVPEPARNRYGRDDGAWTAITLMARDGVGRNQDQPPLVHLPILSDLIAREGITPFGMHIIRQPAGGTLRWHFDNQALHLDVCRLLIAGQVPVTAYTWIGHERLAFPAGTLWTGDFALPHQVENPSDQDRLVIAIDCAVTPEIRALFPAALSADAATRRFLAQEACNRLADHRVRQTTTATA